MQGFLNVVDGTQPLSGALLLLAALLTIAGLVDAARLARRPQEEDHPLWRWLLPATAVMVLGAAVAGGATWSHLGGSTSHYDGMPIGDHWAQAVFMAAPMLVATGASTLLMTAATAGAALRREGWRALVSMVTLVTLCATAATLFELLFSFHHGVAMCEPWEPGRLEAFMRGENQLIVAQGALLTCGMGAALALAGWALHPASHPSPKESAGVAACLLLSVLPALAAHQLAEPWREGAFLNQMPPLGAVVEQLPTAPAESNTICATTQVLRWEDEAWVVSAGLPLGDRIERDALVTLPTGAAVWPLLKLPGAQHPLDIAVRDPTPAPGPDSALSRLGRVRSKVFSAIPALSNLDPTHTLTDDADGLSLRTADSARALPRGAALAEALGAPAPEAVLHIEFGPTLTIDELLAACAWAPCMLAESSPR